jgi:CubicO group peptidase (beta-lactamase class C family)
MLKAFVRDSMNTTGIIIIKSGEVVLSFGDTQEVSYIASARKSIVSMLYGKYVENSTINLNTTLKELNITDIQGLLPIEEKASIKDILTSSSGVYHPPSNEGSDPNMPQRGTKQPGTYFVYNNWDFNVAGTILEEKTNKSIYYLFEKDIALPIGMQDYEVSKQKKYGDSTVSIHQASHFYLSTRDMARLGYLMLRKGNWNGNQIIPESWVTLTTAVLHNNKSGSSIFKNYGYMWWVADENSDELIKGAYSAIGAYGQFITIIPKLDMVIAHKTKASYERHTTNYDRLINLIVENEKMKSKKLPNKYDYVGTYEFTDKGELFQFAILDSKDGLKLKGDKSFPFEFELNLCDTHTGMFVFRQMNNEVIKIHFRTENNDKVTGLELFGDFFLKKQ